MRRGLLSSAVPLAAWGWMASISQLTLRSTHCVTGMALGTEDEKMKQPRLSFVPKSH